MAARVSAMEAVGAADPSASPTLPTRFSALLRSLVPCSSGAPGVAAVTAPDRSATLASLRGVPRASAVRGWARCDVERGIAVEEPGRLKRESGPVGRHDRPVLGPGDVVSAQGVPQHDVGVLDRAVSFGPGRQPGAARVLVGVVACREALIRLVRGNPQMLRRECGTLGHRGVGVAESQDVAAWNELVARLVPEPAPVA